LAGDVRLAFQLIDLVFEARRVGARGIVFGFDAGLDAPSSSRIRAFTRVFSARASTECGMAAAERFREPRHFAFAVGLLGAQPLDGRRFQRIRLGFECRN
jgi:hypothetical protein